MEQQNDQKKSAKVFKRKKDCDHLTEQYLSLISFTADPVFNCFIDTPCPKTCFSTINR